MQAATSITHEHLLSVINTELGRFQPGTPLKILDVGCGNGKLIAYLSESLPLLNPGRTFEVYGFDVGDHGVQAAGFMHASIEGLTARFPDVSWAERIGLLKDQEPWPYPDGFFDVVVSNQVGEHVTNHDLFFGEIRRTLKDGGFSAHLFPLRHYVYEGHLHLPWVHRIGDHDLLRAYIKALSVIGLGKYRQIRARMGGDVDLDVFAERHADYMYFFTNYLGSRDVFALGKRHRLRTSFRYTQDFYFRKLRAMLGRRPVFTYRPARSAVGAACWFFLLKHVSSVTVFLEKRETYAK